MMRKAVLQNCKALDTAFQGDICAIIQSECYIFIPNKSFNVTHLMNHMKNQISALNDPFPSLDDLYNKTKQNQFGVGSTWLKYLLLISLIFINYTLCIFPVSKDYCFLYYQVYD